MTRQGGEAEEVIQVRPCPADRAIGLEEAEELRWPTDLALAHGLEVERPASLVPGEADRVEVAARLVGARQRSLEPGRLDIGVGGLGGLQRSLDRRLGEAVAVGGIEPGGRLRPRLEAVEPARLQVVEEAAHTGTPEVGRSVDRVAGLEAGEGALGQGRPVGQGSSPVRAGSGPPRRRYGSGVKSTSVASMNAASTLAASSGVLPMRYPSRRLPGTLSSLWRSLTIAMTSRC